MSLKAFLKGDKEYGELVESEKQQTLILKREERLSKELEDAIQTKCIYHGLMCFTLVLGGFYYYVVCTTHGSENVLPYLYSGGHYLKENTMYSWEKLSSISMPDMSNVMPDMSNVYQWNDYVKRFINTQAPPGPNAGPLPPPAPPGPNAGPLPPPAPPAGPKASGIPEESEDVASLLSDIKNITVDDIFLRKHILSLLADSSELNKRPYITTNPRGEYQEMRGKEEIQKIREYIKNDNLTKADFDSNKLKEFMPVLMMYYRIQNP